MSCCSSTYVAELLKYEISDHASPVIYGLVEALHLAGSYQGDLGQRDSVRSWTRLDLHRSVHNGYMHALEPALLVLGRTPWMSFNCKSFLLEKIDENR